MKLQRNIAMALSVFYLISVIGLAMNMHFCSGKLADVSFKKHSGCGSCKGGEQVEKDSKCCKDTAVQAKIKDSHKAGNKVDLPQDFSLELFFGSFISEIFKMVLPHTTGNALNKAPPLSAVLSLHVFNCVFRN